MKIQLDDAWLKFRKGWLFVLLIMTPGTLVKAWEEPLPKQWPPDIPKFEIHKIASTPPRQAAFRNLVMTTLQPKTRDSVLDLEKKTRLVTDFIFDPNFSEIGAFSGMDLPNQKPTIMLGPNWRDEWVAHELMHLRMDLSEGFIGLRPRRTLTQMENSAMVVLISCISDQVVNARLLKTGYKLEGGIVDSNFDTQISAMTRALYDKPASIVLNPSSLFPADIRDIEPMATLVTLELFLKDYGDKLSQQHGEGIKQYTLLFRARLKRESAIADRILGLFQKYDVQTVSGHRQIVDQSMRLFALERIAEMFKYTVRDGRYIAAPVTN